MVRRLEQDEVQVVFVKILSVVVMFLIDIFGLGLLSSLGMKHLPLHTSTDNDWGVVVLEPTDSYCYQVVAFYPIWRHFLNSTLSNTYTLLLVQGPSYRAGPQLLFTCD